MPTPPVPSPTPGPLPPSKPTSATLPPANATTPKSRVTILVTFIGVFLFLFVLFLLFLVVMLFQNQGQNPLLGALGVEPAYLRQLLSVLVNLVFGFLSLALFILTLVGLFRRLTSAPAELDKKKSGLIMAALGGFSFLIMVSLWLGLYFYLSQLQVGSSGARVVLSDPLETINLTAPVSITFTAREIEMLYQREGIVSYAWDLDGDGAFDDGNGRDIQYTYQDQGNESGTYMVGLKVILADGREEIAQKLVTIANVRPKISVEYTPKLLKVPMELTFDATDSIDADGQIISYDWDFDADDVVDAQGSVVKQTFTEPVDREVKLTVMDNNGQISEEIIVLAFSTATPEQALIIARPGTAGGAPFSVTLDGSQSQVGEQIQAYRWDFGDGTALGSGRVIQHVYNKGGNYTVRLTVSVASGQEYFTEQVIQVEDEKQSPLPIITGKDLKPGEKVLKGNAPYLVDFDASTSRDPDGRIIEQRWDFDGDSVDDAFGPQSQYTFVEKGTYRVRLTVVDNDEIEAVTFLEVQVTIPDVSVEIEASQPSGTVPLEVTFDASASRSQVGNIISYTWDFGDKTPKVIGSARQTHVYTEVGEFTAVLNVLTDSGARATKTLLIVVREIELQADFSYNPQEAQAGEKIFFDGSASQGQISRYYWDLGDGNISRIVKPEHVYEQPGEYRVLLEVYDRKNRVSRKEVQLQVLPSSP